MNGALKTVRFIAVPMVIAAVQLLSAFAARADQQLAALDGKWLASSAGSKNHSSLRLIWESVFTISNGTFTVTQFWDSSTPLRGTFRLNPSAAGEADISVEKFVLPEEWDSLTYPKGTLPAIYKLSGSQLTICFQTGPSPTRPKKFDAESRDTHLLTLTRAPAGFKKFADLVTISVQSASGVPALGARLFTYMNCDRTKASGKEASKWWYEYDDPTDRAGLCVCAYRNLYTSVICAHDPQHHLIGIASLSPASLADGKVTLKMAPECRVHGSIKCDSLAKLHRSLEWTNVYLHCDGRTIGGCQSSDGAFEFALPAGDFQLEAYGRWVQARTVDLHVPDNQRDYAAPDLTLEASQWFEIQGKPAPELTNVVAWKGTPVKLADLKGKYVLLDFWGYWCGPCVAEMPVLMALHDRFKDSKLAIVGVHVDTDGEVDTVAKLDERLTTIRTKHWKGRDLPFPVALTSGRKIGAKGAPRSKSAAQEYGIFGYPTTVLIDPHGIVVGSFDAHDEKTAVAAVEKLLGSMKQEK